MCEDSWYVKRCHQPFKKVGIINRKYDLTKPNKKYYKAVRRKLEWHWERNHMTQLCLLASIKGFRWGYNPFNGKNNVNGTTTDHKEFYTDPKTVEMTDLYIEDAVMRLRNPNVMWELVNEWHDNVGVLTKWASGRIKTLRKLSIPRSRIAVDWYNASKFVEFLKKEQVWCFHHSVNSPKTMEWWFRSGERKPIYDELERFAGSGDGGDEFEEAEGINGSTHNWKFRKASSKQMGKIIEINFDNDGGGFEFMSACAFVFNPTEPKSKARTPNLEDAIRIATKGLTLSECQKLEVNYYHNRKPELNSILSGYRRHSADKTLK
jgi:hypothetical protein